MRRSQIGALCLVALFLLALMPVHTANSSMRENKSFSVLAADGDQSSASIKTFSTTLGGLSGYPDVMFYPDNESYGSGYAEDFSDVSDWSGYSLEAGDTMTSDGDVGTITYHYDANSDYWQTALTLGVITGYRIEMSIEYNVSGSKAAWDLLTGGLLGAGGSVAQTYSVAGGAADTWYTRNYLVTATDPITGIAIYLSNTVGFTLKFDYLRIAPANEMGWSHDGSTTAGVTVGAGSGGTVSTDGDYITLTPDADGSTFDFWVDTTATVAGANPNYYPYLHIALSSSDITAGAWIRVQGYAGTWLNILDAQAVSKTDYYLNIRAATASAYTYFRLWAYGSVPLHLDAIGAYGIANFTYSGSSVTTSDYLYVTSGVLYSHVSTGTIVETYDPALSIAQASYQVYNLSTAGTAPEFSQYASSWSTYSDDTRGATSSPTVTDVRLRFDSTEDISAITFIEDSTGPVVIASYIDPQEPSTNESVSLNALVTDNQEVMSVEFVPLNFPVNFTNTTYDASEGAGNLWIYSFSSLEAGYYLFKIVASDGVNENNLTKESYLEMYVGPNDILYQLFLSTSIYGLLGPFMVVVIGAYLASQKKMFAVAMIWFLIECIFVYEYLILASSTPMYYWNAFIILLGGIFALVFPQIGRRH